MKKVPSEDRFAPFSDDEVREAMKELSPEWKVKKGLLERKFAFKDFREALAFTNEIGRIAEEENHYPEIILWWGEVSVALKPHSKKDFQLARHIEAEYSTHTRIKKAS